MATICTLAPFIDVAGELDGEVGVDEASLWVEVLPEYDSRSMFRSGVVDTETTELSQNLTSDPVTLTRFEHDLARANIVRAVVQNIPHPVFRDRLVPRQIQFHVEDTQLNLELLEALLDGAELVDISVGELEPVSYTHLRAHETPEHLV